MSDVRTLRVFIASPGDLVVERRAFRGAIDVGQTHSGETGGHRGIETGHRHHHRRHDQDSRGRPHDGSGRPHRVAQPPGTQPQFRRLDHAHVEGQAGRRARLPNLGQDRHHAPPSVSELN